MEEIPHKVYQEFEVEATRYIDLLFTGSLRVEVYSLNLAREMAKTAFIAGKVKQIQLDKNKS